MRVLFIGTAGKYGAQLSLAYLCKELKNKGVDVEVVIPNKGETDFFYEQEGIPFHIIKNGLMWYDPEQNFLKRYLSYAVKIFVNILAEMKINRIIKNESIDIVHINSIGVGVGIKSAKKNNKKIVWHIREFVKDDLNRRLFNEQATYAKVNEADVIITISNAIKEYYGNVIEWEKMHTVYNGIEDRFVSGKDRGVLINGKTRIVVPGRICKEKGQRYVVDALNCLKQYRNKIIVDFCGDSNGNNTEMGYLIRQIEKNDLKDNVIFSGYCSAMHEKYLEADICIVPSKREAFGRVTVEAMMNGCLVIGANSGGTAEILDDNRGLLFQSENSNDLAKKIQWVMENKKQAQDIAHKAQTYAKKVFTASDNADNILKIYNSIF